MSDAYYVGLTVTCDSAAEAIQVQEQLSTIMRGHTLDGRDSWMSVYRDSGDGEEFVDAAPPGTGAEEG